MKILMIQHRFFPAIGGSENHVALLSRELIKRGRQVTVYTTTSLTNKDTSLFTPTPQLPKKEVLNGVEIRRFDVLFRYWSFNLVPEMFKQIKRKLREFDVVHAHQYHLTSSIIACYYAKKYGIPFILTGHDLIIPESLPRTAKLLKRLYDLTFGRYLLKNSTRLIALTEDHIRQYTERGGDISKIRIIPNGIELDKYKNTKTSWDIIAKYGIDNEDKVLLFVGRIEKYKGIQDVIEAMPEILKEFPEAKFIVVGKDYGFRGELEKMEKKLNVGDRIIFTGSVLEDKLIELYRRADIFILPSKMEGFGIVLLEAMAAKTFCIAYPIPSVRRVIKNNENGILVKDKNELLNKILYYLDNIEERKRIEVNALKYVERYNIKNIVNEIEKVYEEALN